MNKSLVLDLINPNCYNMIYALYADKHTRFISIAFTYDNQPFDLPEGATIRVEGKNDNNHDIFHDVTIKNNKAVLKLAKHAHQTAGRFKCKLSICAPETNEVLHCIDFNISIADDSSDPDFITNSSEYSALVNTMMRAKLLINKTIENIHIFELIKKKWKAIKLDALETITDTNIAKDNAIQATDDLRELEADVTEAEGIRREHENTRESQEQTRQSNEDIRKSNENSRQENEADRQDNENIRNTQENSREDNEAVRKTNEALRQSQENTRQNNEDIRQNNEGIRDAQEIVREDNEAIRIANENLRQSQEDTRQENEDARDTAENIRQDSESERQENEDTRETQEDVRQSNETTRLMNESIRQDQEDDRQENETIREDNETIRIANEMSRQSQENDRNDSEDARKSDEITRQQQEADRQSNTSDAIANVETATQNAIDATENADKAADRANLAADGCEEIIAGTGFISVTEKGAVDGLATLDSNKKLIATQLPLGETTTTAFAGDKGKALEDKLDDMKEEINDIPRIPIDHSSDTPKYGEATTSEYGHVKFTNLSKQTEENTVIPFRSESLSKNRDLNDYTQIGTYTFAAHEIEQYTYLNFPPDTLVNEEGYYLEVRGFAGDSGALIQHLYASHTKDVWTRMQSNSTIWSEWEKFGSITIPVYHGSDPLNPAPGTIWIRSDL